MYPALSDIINSLFGTDFDWPVKTYGLFLAFAFITAGIIVYFELKRKEKEGLLDASVRNLKKTKKGKDIYGKEVLHPYQLTSNIIVWGIIGGLAGAKIFHNLENINDLISDPVGAIFSINGLTFYGGLIGGTIAVYYYTTKNGIHWRYMIDVAAPAIMLAYAVGRLGCFIAGDGCWGIPNLSPKPECLWFLPDLMWAYNFPHNAINEGIRMNSCLGNHCFMLEQPVYPTMLYESIISLIFFIVLWFIRKRLIVPGMLFSIFLIMNGTERFFIEKIRINNKYVIFNIEFTQAELISLCLVITGITGLYFFNRIRNKPIRIKKQQHES